MPDTDSMCTHERLLQRHSDLQTCDTGYYEMAENAHNLGASHDVLWRLSPCTTNSLHSGLAGEHSLHKELNTMQDGTAPKHDILSEC